MKNKIKKILKKNFPKGSIGYRVLRKIFIGYRKINNSFFSKAGRKEKRNVTQTINDIATKKDYVALYHPNWAGVRNATIGMFENSVGLIDLHNQNNINKIIDSISSSDLKQVIFSQPTDGTIDIIKGIKNKNNKIKIKVIWHANNYETNSDYTWNFKSQIIDLLNDKTVYAIAFVKSSMTSFYKNLGYNSFHLANVVPNFDVKLEKEVSNKNNKIKIGLYNMESRELKNIYNQLSAASLFDNAIVDIVPSNDNIEKYAEFLGIQYTSVKEFISSEELLNRMSKNDVNLYATFTECSPMLPLESFYAGVPCLVGNNNDYFINTNLYDDLVVEREDDPVLIKSMIESCIKNKKQVIRKYKDWEIEYNKNSAKKVQDFLNS